MALSTVLLAPLLYFRLREPPFFRGIISPAFKRGGLFWQVVRFKSGPEHEQDKSKAGKQFTVLKLNDNVPFRTY